MLTVTISLNFSPLITHFSFISNPSIQKRDCLNNLFSFSLFFLKSVFEILICLIEGADWVVGKDPVFGNKGCDQGI